jgi:hypothetical protein
MNDSRTAIATPLIDLVDESMMRLGPLVLVVALAGCAGIPPAAIAPPVAPAAPAAAPSTFTMSKAFSATNIRKSCPPQGNANPDSVKTLNILKSRVDTPVDADMDPAVTLEAMLQPDDDEERWDEAKAGNVTAFVHDVKVGGIETINCKATDPEDRDPHIELVLDPDHDRGAQRVIVEVTPGWRDRMRAQNIDWSTTTLKERLIGRWVRVKGWLFFDQEHVNQAENTNPGNDKNWRATVWELHPITFIEVLPGKPH